MNINILQRSVFFVIVTIIFLSGCITNPSEPEMTNYDAILQEAEIAYKQKQYQLALSKYQQYAQLHSDNAKLWQRIATLQAKLSDYQGAIESYEKSISLNPNLPLSWHNLSVLQIQKTKQVLNGFLRYTPEDHPLFPKAMRLNDKLIQLYGKN